MKKFALIALLALSLAACSKTDTGKAGGPYLAKVNGVTITQADFERELDALPDYARQLFSEPEGREKFLNEIVNKEVLYREALKKGLDKTPDFQKKVEDFRKLSLVSELFEKEVMAKAAVSDQEVKDYYDKHRDDFTVTTEIKASHILVKTEAEAQKVLERLKAGEKFSDVAKAVSIDKGSAGNGGNLGYFKKGQMVPVFEKAAAALAVGAVSVPVKTEFGYHVILVTDKKKGPTLDFERVHDVIRQKLAADRQKEAFDTYLAEAKKTYKVEINKEALAKIGEAAETGKKGSEMKPEEKAPVKEEKKAEQPKPEGTTK